MRKLLKFGLNKTTTTMKDIEHEEIEDDILERSLHMARLQLGQDIKYWRKKKGYRQSDLGDRLGCHHSYLSEIENGNQIPSFKIIQKICNALDLYFVIDGKNMSLTKNLDIL